MPSANNGFLLKKIIALSTLAELSVLSVRQIQRLVKDGVISLARDKKGNPIRARVVLGEAVPKLFEHSRNTHAVGDPAIARFRRARAKREEADAAMAEIELGYHRGKYLLASAVEEDLIRMLTACRARMLAIPSAVARSLIALTDTDRLSESERFRQIYQLIEDKVYAALTEIADLSKAGRRDGEQMMQRMIERGVSNREMEYETTK
jgi:hypothetical protein